MTTARALPSLDVCIPVWNRADLLGPCVSSLRRHLRGIDAAIWLVDNGSDAATREVIGELADGNPDTYCVRFPRNMGIPHAVNVFVRAALQDCSVAGRRRPEYLMLLDSDAWFERPVLELIEVLEREPRYGAIAGHRSIEHGAIGHRRVTLSTGPIDVDEKRVERMFCMLLRATDLAAMVPFPHHTNVDVDWELTVRHPASIAASGRVIAAVDNAVHIGLYDSTWHPLGVPASLEEADAIDRVLRDLGLMTPEREARAMAYRAATGLLPERDTARV